jgi:hypothetical protein
MLSAMSEQRDCLIVVLGERVKLAKGLWPLSNFVSDGKVYGDIGAGDFTEFYDWLRNSSGQVLGVRYYLCADTEFLMNYADARDYMLSTDGGTFKYVEIYFTERRDVDPLLSCDQGFLYDPVFRSDEEIAIAFDMGWLSESELRSLEENTSLWTLARC